MTDQSQLLNAPPPSIGLLYDRVLALAAKYEDRAFVAWCADTGTDSIKFLNDQISDTGQDFLAMRSVLEAFPSREDWVKKGLLIMIAEIRQSQKSTVVRESWKNRCLAAEAECEKLRDALQKEKGITRELGETIETMRTKNATAPGLA